MKSRAFCLISGAVAALVLCSCSRNDQQQNRSQGEPSDTGSAPRISSTAAPGVAFSFVYDFNLPDERISASQEAHASACEKLGPARCRITGMSYSVDQNEQVAAELDLKLDPAIAREFGKSAEQSVEASDGKLVRLEIGGSNEGESINQASKQRNDLSAQIDLLQQELAKTRPGSAAHANLLDRIATLRQQAAAETHAIEGSEAALASTPMQFHYYGNGGVPGFRGNPIREAWQTFATTIIWLVGILLQALAVVVPVGITSGLFIALWRSRPAREIRRWIGGPQESEA